jgi:hypothetical protein
MAAPLGSHPTATLRIDVLLHRKRVRAALPGQDAAMEALKAVASESPEEEVRRLKAPLERI